jgi:hypothetical protein
LRGGDYRTIWECYAPDAQSPATRWDNTYYSRQDFVGWSGLGPIALLIEDILGFQVLGREGKIIWTATRTDRHGISNLQLGVNNVVSLVAAARQTSSAALEISATAAAPFVLEVHRPGRATAFA